MTEEQLTPEEKSMEDQYSNQAQAEASPYNELDMQFRTTNPAWGKEATPYLDKKLTRERSDGTEEKNWELLNYYTRDIRLANLNMFEILYCNKWLGIAGDCLRMNYTKSFVTALSRVIDVLELSQSKGGFLRRRHGTFTKEAVSRDENLSKNLLGGKKTEA